MREGRPEPVTIEGKVKKIDINRDYSNYLSKFTKYFRNAEAAAAYISNKQQEELLSYVEYREYRQNLVDEYNEEYGQNDRIIIDNEAETKLERIIPEAKRRIELLKSGQEAISGKGVREIENLLFFAFLRSPHVSVDEVNSWMQDYYMRAASPIEVVDVNKNQEHKGLHISCDYQNAFKICSISLGDQIPAGRRMLDYEDYFQRQWSGFLRENPDVQLLIRTAQNTKTLDAITLIVNKINSILAKLERKKCTDKDVKEFEAVNGVWNKMLSGEVLPSEVEHEIQKITDRYNSSSNS